MNVVELPARRTPSCLICVHALVSAHRTDCLFYDELILREAVAEECESYREDREAT